MPRALFALALSLAVLATTPRAHATPNAAAALTAARAKLGLPALRVDPNAATIAGLLAHPQAITCPGSCAAFLDASGKIDPEKYYDYLSGSKRKLELLGLSDSALATPLDNGLRTYVGDPRVTGFATAVNSAGVNVVVFVFDPATRLAGTVALSKPIDFAGTLRLLVPGARTTQARLLDGRGRPLANVTALSSAGLDGAHMVSILLPALPLAWGTSYRLQLDHTSFSLRTPPFPTAVARRSWQFQPSMSASDRREFSAAFTRAPQLYRRVAGLLDGLVAVSAGAGCDRRESSCARSGSHPVIVMNPQHLADPATARFVALHEFGHIVQFYGLDAGAIPAFQALFARSPAWQSCYRERTSGVCTPLTEILADQFAFWADPQAGQESGYSDPRLATAAQFESVLRAHLSLRIVPGLMPPGSYSSPR